MHGLMQDYPLTTVHLFERAEKLWAKKEVVTSQPDGTRHRYTYGDFAERTRRVGGMLDELGISDSGRVATFGWLTALLADLGQRQASRCGRWEIRATARSCASASAGTTRLPDANARPATGHQSARAVSSSRQVTQAAPANRSADPAAQPDTSVPAIGCDPTNRVVGASSATHCATAALTLATSVSRMCGARSATTSAAGGTR